MSFFLIFPWLLKKKPSDPPSKVYQGGGHNFNTMSVNSQNQEDLITKNNSPLHFTHCKDCVRLLLNSLEIELSFAIAKWLDLTDCAPELIHTLVERCKRLNLWRDASRLISNEGSNASYCRNTFFNVRCHFFYSGAALTRFSISYPSKDLKEIDRFYTNVKISSIESYIHKANDGNVGKYDKNQIAT